MKVFLNGCWDVIHIGHINMLLKAREIAGNGQVIVAIDEDEKVMSDKGLQRPIFDVHARAKAVLDLELGNGKKVVDQIEFFITNTQLEMIIRRHRPDYIMKGGDWRDKRVVGSEHAKVLFYDRMEAYSTTNIIHKVLEKHKL